MYTNHVRPSYVYVRQYKSSFSILLLPSLQYIFPIFLLGLVRLPGISDPGDLYQTFQPLPDAWVGVQLMPCSIIKANFRTDFAEIETCLPTPTLGCTALNKQTNNLSQVLGLKLLYPITCKPCSNNRNSKKNKC